MNDRIILFVIVGELFGSTQFAQLARPRGVKHSGSTTATLGCHSSDGVVTLEWRRLVLKHHYCSTGTRRCKDRRGWGDGMLNSRRRGDRRCQTLAIQERTFLWVSSGLTPLGWGCFITGLFRVGRRAIPSFAARPLNQNTSLVDIYHDICIFNVRGEGLAFGQVIFPPLAVNLYPIPSHAHDFNPIPIEWIRSRLICSLDMNTRDHTTSSELVMA